uniref:Uncharacterized protein n=1 Tax=Ditylenchus dipsaci TaxID=166011 RepID=A0A915E5U6_9BILA
MENLAASSQSILTNAKAGASQAVIESLPADFNIKRIVTNKRKPKGAAEVDKALAVMELSDEFKKTATGEQFLFFDSRATEPGQSVIIIFISMHGRQLLRLYKNPATFRKTQLCQLLISSSKTNLNTRTDAP